MKKMLLMGSAGAGKTSMHYVIFAHFPARETSKIGYTVAKEEHKFIIMGNLELRLWDCGFQNTFVEGYFNERRDYMFSGTALMLYVFDVTED
jgi:Ras-related GTP-binding protein A/B